MKKYRLLLIVLLLFACSGDKKKEISGCTDTLANNYNPEASIDDGSCISFVGRWSAYKKGRIESFVEFLNDGTMTSQASKDEVMELNWEDTDGSHYQTKNTYTIFIYYKGFNDETETLIGVKRFVFQ